MNKVKATLMQAAERIQTATHLPIQCYFANVVGDIVLFEEDHPSLSHIARQYRLPYPDLHARPDDLT